MTNPLTVENIQR